MMFKCTKCGTHNCNHNKKCLGCGYKKETTKKLVKACKLERTVIAAISNREK